MAAGREEALLAGLQLGLGVHAVLGEQLHVLLVGHDSRKDRRVDVVGLDDHLARQFGASGAARNLRKELVRALAGTEIRHVEGAVRIEDADQGDVREVESLRDHLRPKEDVRLAAAESREEVVMRILARSRIGVHPQNARVRKALLQGRFRPLCADALEVKAGTLALGTVFRNRNPLSADMTAKAGVRPVVSVGNAAVRTADDESAAGADGRSRISAAVQEENRLLVPVKPLTNGLEELAREDHPASASRLPPHVLDPDVRKPSRPRAPRHLRKRILAALHVHPAFERRRRRTEHDARALERAAENRHVTRIVPRRLVLLVARLVLLVDDDKPKIADHDARRTRADAMPFVVALAVRQRRMQDRHPIPEARSEAAYGLRRQRDLRHHHDGAASGRKLRRDRLQIDLRLAGTGDAEKECG